MSAFDEVIGYGAIKEELLQICDMINNKEVYTTLGAKFPKGILLYGDPGLGKTLMAKCFIQESGLGSYTIRRNKGNNDFIGDITDTFKKAKTHTPCIIFLDDLDKFANEDNNHCDAEEYVAVQAGIDEVKNRDVLILATANNVCKLPDSLLRSGRFDRKIKVEPPDDSDAEDIIKYYLSDKRVSQDINMEDLSKMISYSSCAELETILNEAAIGAAYARKTEIEMDDLVKAVFKMHYGASDYSAKIPEEDQKKIALHEAGHLVAAEALCSGCVGFASLNSTMYGSDGGYVHLCKRLTRRPFHVLIALASKAAVELYHADTVASGCQDDINKAIHLIRDGLSENATLGFSFLDIATENFESLSDSLCARNEAVTQSELERYLLKARDILLKNRDFLEKTAEALYEKGTLRYSDIKKIKESTVVTEVAV